MFLTVKSHIYLSQERCSKLSIFLINWQLQILTNQWGTNTWPFLNNAILSVHWNIGLNGLEFWSILFFSMVLETIGMGLKLCTFLFFLVCGVDMLRMHLVCLETSIGIKNLLTMSLINLVTLFMRYLESSLELTSSISIEDDDFTKFIIPKTSLYHTSCQVVIQ